MFGIGRNDKSKTRPFKKNLSRWQLDEREQADELRKMNALLRYHFKLDPDELDDNEFAMRWNELDWILKKMNSLNENDS